MRQLTILFIWFVLLFSRSFDSFKLRCSITNTDVHFNQVATEDEDLSATDSTTPILQLKSDVLETESLNILTGDTYVDNLLTALPVCSSLYISLFITRV